MQSSMEIVRSYYSAIDHGDLEKAGQCLADDFQRFGSTPGATGKAEALKILHLLKTAMPDLSYALSNIEMHGSVVKLTVQAGGRHTQPLNLADLGIGVAEGIVPGSGRMIIFLPDDLEYTVINGKITMEQNVTPPTLFNGVNGFLHEIGFSEYAGSRV